MAANLTMVRIATKLDDLFNEKIDISDVKTSDDDRSTFYSRAIAALSIMIQCGIDETLSGSCVTDGYHDMGIDAVYNDSTQKKLVLVQSKWRRDGTGGISQEEAGSFAQGVKRIINSDVNQGIKEVLRTEPEKFFYYNNGVKLLCRKITRKAAHSTDRITGLFALEGVSLVNGAQTTGSIGAVYADMPDVVARAKVFIQMIDLADTEEEQATQITRFTNTQNRIDGKDFAALDPEQERIKNELSFSGIQYLYKTGATIEDPLHQITLDEAIIAQACSIDELSIVALAKRNVGALTENINKTPYKLLFNGGTNSFSLTNNVWIARVVDSFLAQNENIKRTCQNTSDILYSRPNKQSIQERRQSMKKAVGGKTRVDLAVDQIIQVILDRDMKAGDKLPNEYDLARELGVGRSTLREAIKRLVARNILTARQGAGTFVSEKNGVPEDPLGLTFMMEEGSENLALDLQDIRLMLEPETCAIVARGATPEQIDQMQAYCDEVTRLIEAEEDYSAADAKFHRYLAECSGNHVLPNLIPIIASAIGVVITVTNDEHRSQSGMEHQRIIDAIRRHDPEGAKYSMIAHLNTSRNSMVHSRDNCAAKH